MINFQYLDYIPNGHPVISEDLASLTQNITVITGIVGNTYTGKFIQGDSLDVVFPSTGLDATQIIALIITKAQEFVAANYPSV